MTDLPWFVWACFISLGLALVLAMLGLILTSVGSCFHVLSPWWPRFMWSGMRCFAVAIPLPVVAVLFVFVPAGWQMVRLLIS